MLHERELADTVEVPDPHDDRDRMRKGAVRQWPGVFGLPGGGSDAYGGGEALQRHRADRRRASSMHDGSILESANIVGRRARGRHRGVARRHEDRDRERGRADPSAPIASGNSPRRPLHRSELRVPDGSGMVANGIETGVSMGTINVLNTSDMAFHPDGELQGDCSGNSMGVPGQPTAVTFTPDGAHGRAEPRARAAAR